MAFGTEQQLADFLGSIQPHYRDYAAPLWASVVRSADELANGSVDTLVEAGITNRLHAENIKAKAAAAAAAAAPPAAAAAAAAAGDAVGLSEVLKQLEILKEQQQLLLTEQQQVLTEQQQQLLAEQQQVLTEQQQLLLAEQQQVLTEQQRLLLAEQQQVLTEQQQVLTEQQQQLLAELHQQLLAELHQNYQGLILDLFHPTSSVASNKELKRYRDRALVFYYGSSSYAAYTCMVTGMECSVGELVAGHIYRQQWPKSWLAKVGITLHDPSNIIIMQSQLERAFDKWQWIVLPDGPDDYKVHVLYPPFLDDPMQQYISGNAGKGMRWQDIHGGKLKLPGLARPSRRLCGFHAALAIQNAEVQGWVPKGSVVLPDTSWDSPNCDKQLMQQFLNSLDLCGARRLQMSEAAEDDSDAG